MPSAREVPCTSVVDSAQKPALLQRIVINSIEPAPRTILFIADTNGSAREFILLGFLGLVILPRSRATVLRLYRYAFNFQTTIILTPSNLLPPISHAESRANDTPHL